LPWNCKPLSLNQRYRFRKPALTPIIAGSICGGLLIISWTIGFIVYFRKRYNRKQRKRLIAEGKAQPREKDLKMLQEKVVIPPDPAVLLGHRKPGEMVFPERQQSSPGKSPWSHQNSRTLPSSDSQGSTSGTSSTNNSPRHVHSEGRSNAKEAKSPDTELVNTEINISRVASDIASDQRAGVVACTTRTSINPGDPTEPEVDIQVADVMTIPSRV